MFIFRIVKQVGFFYISFDPTVFEACRACLFVGKKIPKSQPLNCRITVSWNFMLTVTSLPRNFYTFFFVEILTFPQFH